MYVWVCVLDVVGGWVCMSEQGEEGHEWAIRVIGVKRKNNVFTGDKSVYLWSHVNI